MRRARGGLSRKHTPGETARAFVDKYGAAAAAVARDRIAKAGTPENEAYWREVEVEIGKLPPGDSTKIGRCSHCGHGNLRLVATLVADPTKHVCAACHADPAVPTVPR